MFIPLQIIQPQDTRRRYLSATIKGYLRLKINLFILFITIIVIFTRLTIILLIHFLILSILG